MSSFLSQVSTPLPPNVASGCWTADHVPEIFLNHHSGQWGCTVKIHASEFDYAAALKPVRPAVALIGVGTSRQEQLNIFILEVDPGLATHPARRTGIEEAFKRALRRSRRVSLCPSRRLDRNSIILGSH